MPTSPIMDHSLKRRIIELIQEARNNKIFVENVTADSCEEVLKNEFLFFIKPEITGAQTANLEAILDLLFDRISRFGLRIHGIRILSASYLEKYGIIAQHYGVINKIASDARSSLSALARTKFEEYFGEEVNNSPLVGGIEILKAFPALNAYSLDYLWQNLKNRKLAPGTYCEEIRIDNEKMYLFNGFHPRQLEHFVEPGKSIVVFTLSGNISWATARREFIGATRPEDAAEGSLRRELLESRQEFGLKEVSQGMNGFHLSAGPVEALIELQRYNSNFSSKEEVKNYLSFSFGKALETSLPNAAVETILSNADLKIDGGQVSIFDLTEEMDSDEALRALKMYLQ